MNTSELSYWVKYVGKACCELSGPINDLGEALQELSNVMYSLSDSGIDAIEVRATEESISLETPKVST